jgi:hypothetical protein
MSAQASLRLRVFLGAVAVVSALVFGQFNRTAAQQLPQALPPPFSAGAVAGEPAQVCGSLGPIAEAALRLRPRRVLDDSIPLAFDQDPVLLSGDYRGTVTLRNFLVSGDLASIEFRPVGGGPAETWTRSDTGRIGNRAVSVFSPTWNQQQIAAAFGAQEVGFDNPYLYWGEVLPPGVAAGSGYGVYLRVLSNSIPQVTVRQVADDVQYSSAVVNIRMDDYGSTLLLEDENYYAFDKLTKRFYELFEDSYDSIGITTASARVTTPTMDAFHQNIKNDIRGIGQSLFDQSTRYGSVGRLSGVEFYTGAMMTSNRPVAHETAHRWAAYIDWAKVAGLGLAGHQPTAHDPLMTGGETRMGAVLSGTRRVENVNGAWTIQRTPAPIFFHPYTLYAMGFMSANAVPEITFFDEQGQFSTSHTSSPSVGTAVTGSTRSATAFSVVGALGPRDGPVSTTWDQALVVISSGRLLSRREMDYWTFYAQRTADPNGSGVIAWNGYGSFDLATSQRINLTHEIRPRGGDPIREPLPVDAPRLAPTDFRDVLPDAPVATLYDAGERLHITGRVTATDRNDFTSVLIGLYRDPGGSADFVRADSAISGNGTFDATFPVFTAAQKGQWLIEVYLFWPNSGSQSARAFLGPVTVR